jgi:hypothetical protein
MVKPKVFTKTPPEYTTPPWLGTPMTAGRVLIPGGGFLHADDFYYTDTVVFTVGAAGASADATTVPGAFSHPTPGMSIDPDLVLPVGTVLDFGGDKFATLTAAATPADDTSITVRELVTALVEDDAATYMGGASGRKYVPDGLLLGRTFAERASNQGYGPADLSGDEQFALLAFPISNAVDDNFCELVIPNAGVTIYENKLPDWSNWAANAQSKVRELYNAILF